MFFAYTDSSGKADYQDNLPYVLASTVIHEYQWQLIDNGVKQIKIKHFPQLSDSDVEFHAKDMTTPSGVYFGKRWEEIYAIFDDIFAYIASVDVTIFAVTINKTKLLTRTDIEELAYTFLFERLETYFERQNRVLFQQGKPKEFGIAIVDSDGVDKDEALRKKLLRMRTRGTMYKNFNYLIEDPFFTDSRWRNPLQLADSVAYCVRKKFKSNSPSIHTTHWESYFPQIFPKFFSINGYSDGLGLKVFPK